MSGSVNQQLASLRKRVDAVEEQLSVATRSLGAVNENVARLRSEVGPYLGYRFTPTDPARNGQARPLRRN